MLSTYLSIGRMLILYLSDLHATLIHSSGNERILSGKLVNSVIVIQTEEFKNGNEIVMK